MNAAVKITASVNGQQAVDQLRSSMDKLRDGAMSVGKTFAAGFIGVQAIQGVVNFGKSVIDAADTMDEMAQRTGLTVEQLSELDYAAKLSGTSIDSVQTAMGKLAAKATDVAAGNKTAKVAFDALGVSVKDSNGNLKSQLQLFEEVGQGIAAINDPTLRAAMAIEIFGKSGAQLLPLLQDMGALRKEARDLGGVIGSDFAANAARFNDNLDRMTLLSKGLAKSILSDLIPAVNRMMETMIQASKSGGFFDMLGAGMKQMVNNAAVDYVNVDKSIADITAKVANLKKMRDDLTKDTLANRINNAIFGDVDTIDSQLKNFETVLGQLNEIKRKATEANNPANNSQADAAAKRALDSLSKTNKETLKLTDAQREAKQQEEERARILQQLTDSVFKLKEGEDALTIQKLKSLGASDKEIEQAKNLMSQREVLNDATERQKELEKQIDEARKAFLKEGEDRMRAQIAAAEELERASTSVWESTRTPLEQYNNELERLKKLYDAGGISADTLARAQTKALEELKSVGSSVWESTRTPLEQYNNELERLKKLYDASAISAETYSRAQNKALEEFASAGASVFNETRTPLENYNAELERLQQLYDQGSISAETFARAQTKALEDLKAVGASVFNETRTPLEKYNIELQKLDELLQNGAISFETWQRGAENARKQLEETGKTGDSVFKGLESAILGFGKQSTDAFVDFVSGAKVSFEDLAMSILKDLAKMALYMTVTKPLFSWLGGFMPNADGNAFMGGNVVPFANGGVVTGPTIFPMANGAGLMGEAGPEAIMPLQRTPSGKLGVIAQGGGNTNNVTVNVNVESGQSSTQGDGQQANLLGGFIAKAVQAELLKQKRPGGVLFAGA